MRWDVGSVLGFGNLGFGITSRTSCYQPLGGSLLGAGEHPLGCNTLVTLCKSCFVLSTGHTVPPPPNPCPAKHSPCRSEGPKRPAEIGSDYMRAHEPPSSKRYPTQGSTSWAHSSVLIILKCQRAVTGLKADVTSHLDTTAYVTQHCYWLIMIHGHKLSYGWPPYIAASSEVPRICWYNLQELLNEGIFCLINKIFIIVVY
jgi:hypothetical protein